MKCTAPGIINNVVIIPLMVAVEFADLCPPNVTLLVPLSTVKFQLCVLGPMVCVGTSVLSRFISVQLFATPRNLAHQILPFMGLSRQKYWSGLPCAPPGDLPYPGIRPPSPALQVDSLPLSHWGAGMFTLVTEAPSSVHYCFCQFGLFSHLLS